MIKRPALQAMFLWNLQIHYEYGPAQHDIEYSDVATIVIINMVQYNILLNTVMLRL